MTVSLKHAFTSNVADSGDATLVQPSNWNAEHNLTANANSLLGTVTAGSVTEISCTSAGRDLLDDADASAQRTTLGLGSIATQNANNVTITGGSITGITSLEVADGAAASPSITNSGDTNTGVFFPEADGVGISTGGSERFRVGPSGQLGIGGATYGTSGQVLKSAGSSSPPTWSSAAEYYSQATAPSTPGNGAIWYDTDDGAVYVYAGGQWVQVNDSVLVNINRGLFGGGDAGSPSATIDNVNISAIGNATSFGSLSLARSGISACSSNTRGIFGGGTSGASSNVIDYVTIATPGNATDFGDLTVARSSLAACSNGTRGIFGGGSGPSNVIDYITIATTGNALDFGDLTAARSGLAACSNGSRGVFGGGSGLSNVIDYVTIATLGNATDFGDLTVARSGLAACSNGTRGVFGGGNGPSNVIDYITIATTGNATDFGDLTVARNVLAACSNGTRGVFGGGSAAAVSNVIEFITISTTGNALDFGDLTVARSSLAACSGFYGA